MRWTPAQPLEGLPTSLPVFAVVGHWKPEVLALFVPDRTWRRPARPAPAGVESRTGGVS